VFDEALARCTAGIVDLSPAQVVLLRSHFELLVRWNESLNLTRVTSVEAAVERHYAESLFLAKHMPPVQLRIVDIGSGPGFPGYPVAVLRPDCSVTLVESHQRKAVFLKEAARLLPNVQVLAQRAESVSEKFDLVISRAVSYEDLVNALRKLSSSAALLTGVEVPPSKLRFDWEEPIPLPWGKQRFLRLGTGSRSGSCFT
jgi:16S rRNA (guanine(527)-N(7))-methyltransferase RsmG